MCMAKMTEYTIELHSRDLYLKYTRASLPMPLRHVFKFDDRATQKRENRRATCTYTQDIYKWNQVECDMMRDILDTQNE